MKHQLIVKTDHLENFVVSGELDLRSDRCHRTVKIRSIYCTWLLLLDSATVQECLTSIYFFINETLQLFIIAIPFFNEKKRLRSLTKLTHVVVNLRS